MGGETTHSTEDRFFPFDLLAFSFVSESLFLSFNLHAFFPTPGRRQSKTPILSRNVDQTSLETEFSIAICRHTGDNWQ